MSVEERLFKIGITIPTPPTPVANYVPAVASDKLLYTAGQLPMADGRLPAHGKVGSGAVIGPAFSGQLELGVIQAAVFESRYSS